MSFTSGACRSALVQCHDHDDGARKQLSLTPALLDKLQLRGFAQHTTSKGGRGRTAQSDSDSDSSDSDNEFKERVRDLSIN